MAKLLDLLVAAEGFVPVAGRVYAQDGDGEVWEYTNPSYSKEDEMWVDNSIDMPLRWWAIVVLPLADDHLVSAVSAESVLAMRP